MEEQLSTKSILNLYLMPGVFMTAGYIVLGGYFFTQGYPVLLALLLTIPFVFLPTFIIHFCRLAKRQNGRLSFKGVILYREKLSFFQIISYSLLTVILILIFFAIGSPIDAFLTENLWSKILPEWFLNKDDISSFSPIFIVLILILNLVFNSLIGPIVEELYFRGYVLPRHEHLGIWSPIINAVLFGLYHFWQPYIYGSVILGLIPLTFIAWKKKNIYIAIIAHCTFNLIGFFMLLKSISPF
ncbi:hypothetical protein SAMN05880501_105103 [Ureibacillus xyleni]|uniref:CAAX prenyl protease 2/Lysostaphin resistance protein A-like domain-containing protein n=1 Tax=Ureibacillus xyleni TaxID=614648 RepID=A0A285SLJ9_9BACL|nr:CPBP family intramembrane glutamic endopeptidase [Ureibacillus xyleni]SOC08562.1 hypothetical protein SAMN05880501_105103 [Ureibacillus xyleni]